MVDSGPSFLKSCARRSGGSLGRTWGGSCEYCPRKESLALEGQHKEGVMKAAPKRPLVPPGRRS